MPAEIMRAIVPRVARGPDIEARVAMALIYPQCSVGVGFNGLIYFMLFMITLPQKEVTFCVPVKIHLPSSAALYLEPCRGKPLHWIRVIPFVASPQLGVVRCLYLRVSGRHPQTKVSQGKGFLATGFGGGGVVGCLPPPYFVTRQDQSNWFLTVG